MQMRMIFFIVFTFLLTKTHQQATNDWIDYDLSSEVDSDQFLEAFTRDDEEELEVYSPILTGFKYISGGAGEGRQHLSPDGIFPNRQEIKTDEELPLFCHPPNPCPLGVEGKNIELMQHDSIQHLFIFQLMIVIRLRCQCSQLITVDGIKANRNVRVTRITINVQRQIHRKTFYNAQEELEM